VLRCCQRWRRSAPIVCLSCGCAIRSKARAQTYPLALLRLALAEVGFQAELVPHPLVMGRPRIEKALLEGELDVAWFSMSERLEQLFRPVRVPIFRGLLGHRVFLMHERRLADFAQVQSLQDLAPWRAGVGHGWLDGPIMEAAGLRTAYNTYESLFRMLERGTIDYFPRAVHEAPVELALRAQAMPWLRLEPHVLLRYKSCQIFVTRHDKVEWAQQIEAGLQRAQANGALAQLFAQQHDLQMGLLELRRPGRLHLEIPNPFLSAADRELPASLWL